MCPSLMVGMLVLALATANAVVRKAPVIACAPIPYARFSYLRCLTPHVCAHTLQEPVLEHAVVGSLDVEADETQHRFRHVL
jgi:hypothetical protein